MLPLLAAAALAGPPGGEVLVGWAGNAHQGYGFVAGAPSLARNDEASVTGRVAISHLYYAYDDGIAVRHVDSPGASLGLGFKYAPGALSWGMGISFEARRTSRVVVDDGDAKGYDLELGGAVSTDVYWRASRRSTAFLLGSFSGANAYLWSRVGFQHQIVPVYRRDQPASVWLGLDLTARGNQDDRALEPGLSVEVPVRDLHASFNVRGGLSFEDAGPAVVRQGTVGAGIYWSY
jgi:hypothetical protein